MEFPGTLILVSHDRSFLNNVVTLTLVFEGEGEVNEYPGGYDDWLEQKANAVKPQPAAGKVSMENAQVVKPSTGGKLSFSETRELEGFSSQIEEMEYEQSKLCALLSDPEFYKKDPQEIADAKVRSEALAQGILEKYRRWEELEAKRSALGKG